MLYHSTEMRKVEADRGKAGVNFAFVQNGKLGAYEFLQTGVCRVEKGVGIC